jgi:hypothetical protein
MSQCFTEDAVPPPERVQLLRILPQSGHEAGDPQISPASQMLLAVRAADRQRHLAGSHSRVGGIPHSSREDDRLAFQVRLRCGVPCVGLSEEQSR